VANLLTEQNFTFVRSNFRYLKQWMRYWHVEHIDGLLADLGVSSPSGRCGAGVLVPF
jgi:16S rRNA (cytosine1402-N4)-methyltransferase